MKIFTDYNLLFVIIGFAMIALEVMLGAVTGFELFVIGTVFIIGGAVGYYVGSFTATLVISIGLSLLYVLIGRKSLRKSLSISTHKTNVESIIGRQAEVIKLITPHKPGTITIDGEKWRAESEEKIEVGTIVTIESVSGVTVFVDIA
ncbi:MAG: NfeD family protein [Weeksellaceae bacterium]